ncbi:MAG: hypothetical protein ACKVWV_01230 [Planctomycetota bacterium]
MGRLIKIVVVLAVLLLLAGGAAFVFLDSIVRGAIEKGATYATGVETTLASADVGLLSGHLELEGLDIENPPNFRPEPFLHLDSARASWDGSTVLSQKIEMNEFALEGVTLNIERTSKQSNYGVILGNLQKLSSGTEKPPADDAAGEQRNLRIRRIVIRRVEVGLHLSDVVGLSASQKVIVPEIVIEDFDTSGTTVEIVSKLTQAIVLAVVEASAAAGKDLIPADVLKDLGRGLEGALDSVSKDTLKGLDSALKDVGKGVEDLFKKKP